MELTKEQIQEIEKYLNVKGITFIDLRIEVLDHMISDIEAKTNTENLDFETIFPVVKEKWNAQLKQSSSFYFGEMFSAPKIVINKAKKHFKKWYIISFLVFIFPVLFLKVIKPSFSENIENILNLSFQILTVLSFLIFSILIFLTSRNKTQTIFSFILKTQSLSVLVFFIVLLDLNFFKKIGEIDSFKVGFLISFIFLTYSYFHFYKKHKEAIKKYKVS